MPQSVQPQAQVTLATLGLCHNSGDWEKMFARLSVCFCIQVAGGASIRMLT